MAKSLSARIAERVTKKKPSRNGQNRAAFLALRGDIKQAIDDGWPVKTIWETLHEEGKVAFSYQAFRGYVNRLILSPPAIRDIAPAPAADDSGQSRKSSEAIPTKQPAATGFTFNKTPKKEDLL